MTNLSNTIVQPHKEVESLIRALYDLHVGFDVVRTRVLSPAGLPTTVSKADTLKGAVEAAQKMNTTDSVRVVSFLYNAVIDVVKYSNKFCRSLVLEGDEPERIIQKAKAELAAGNDFKASFPCFPKGEVNPQGRHLVAKVEESGEKVFIFLGKQRTVSERINIPNSAIVADSLAAGTRLVKVSAEALVPYNVLDVLVIDKSSKICEVRLSNCVDGGKRKRALWMKEAVSHVLNMGGISRRVASVNLFSKIRPLYKSFEKDGSDKVTYMEFLTDELDIKKNKSKFDEYDVRNGSYHKGGEKAVGEELTPYYLKKLWERDELTTLGLELPGTDDAAQGDEFLAECFYLNCLCESDFLFLENKLAGC